MLPKNRRIPRKMFPLLRQNGRTYGNGVFLAKIGSNPQKYSRFCVSVSKKVAKSAVVRNRLRRSGYRMLDKYISDIKPNLLVLILFKDIPQKEEDAQKSMEAIIKEAKLIN